MDYEKKYNNALDRARLAIKDCGGNQGRKNMIYGIFPELKGSEDERIRRRIKLCLEECVHAGTIRDYEAEEALAWLEKQKEQKPAFDDYLKATPAGRRKMSMTEILEKEQKPAGWNEEDEMHLNNAILAAEKEWGAGSCTVKFLKSLRPQPKAELDAVAEKEAYKDGFLTARHISANAFMQYLDEHRPEGKMCLSNGECEDINKAFEVGDWAKIIRYLNKYQSHWKPSEEQMKIFNEAIEHYSKYWDSEDIKILCSLYDDLQKLL